MVAAVFKDKTEEEGGNQGTAERKKTEGAGTSQGIQDRGLSQEKDDDDDLPDDSSSKRKKKSKEKRREIKVRTLLRRHRGLQRQRKQTRQRQVCSCGSQIMVSTPADGYS